MQATYQEEDYDPFSYKEANGNEIKTIELISAGLLEIAQQYNLHGDVPARV